MYAYSRPLVDADLSKTLFINLSLQAKHLVSIFFFTPENNIVISELVPHDSFINSKASKLECYKCKAYNIS